MMVASWPSVAERFAAVDASKGAAATSKEPIAHLDRANDRSLAATEVSSGTKEAAKRNGQGLEEVSIGTDSPSRSRRPPADEVEMLRIQVSGFEKVIERLQAEVTARDKSQAEMVKLIRSLQDEVATLKRQGPVDNVNSAAAGGKRKSNQETPAGQSTR
jgi:hypothetical protein